MINEYNLYITIYLRGNWIYRIILEMLTIYSCELSVYFKLSVLFTGGSTLQILIVITYIKCDICKGFFVV